MLLVAGSRLPNFRGQVLAVGRVERLLRKVTRALEAAGVPYAVIGGNAVAAWVTTADEGAVRATKDVDILLRRSDLPAAVAALRPAGLVQDEVRGVTVFLDRRRPNPRTGVHIVFAAERVHAHSGRPAPDVAASVRSASGFQTLDLAALVAMKLEAFRDIDRVHIQDLLAVKLVDESVISRLPEDLRARLRQIQATWQERI